MRVLRQYRQYETAIHVSHLHDLIDVINDESTNDGMPRLLPGLIAAACKRASRQAVHLSRLRMQLEALLSIFFDRH